MARKPVIPDPKGMDRRQFIRHLAPTGMSASAAAVVGFYLWELLKANWASIRLMLSPRPRVQPAIVRIPLDLTSEAAITLLAHMITLTPGTLSLDVTEDKSALYVHTIYTDDIEDFRRGIKEGFERRVQEVFQ